MILDLRIPQNQRYQQIVLDEAVSRVPRRRDRHRAAMKTIEDGWNEVTEEIGKDDQLAAYKRRSAPIGDDLSRPSVRSRRVEER